MLEFSREARLRPEFADHYPGVEPGIWEPVDEVMRALTNGPSQGAAACQAAGRLPDRHFEFRGGIRRGPYARLRTREVDPDLPMH